MKMEKERLVTMMWYLNLEKIEIPASLLLPYGRLVAWYELELGLGRLFRCLLLNMDNCDKDNDTSNNSSNNENGENAMAAQIQIHIMT